MAEEICGAPMGRRPYFLNEDQFDAIRCRCKRPKGHEGTHHCGDVDHMTGENETSGS